VIDRKGTVQDSSSLTPFDEQRMENLVWGGSFVISRMEFVCHGSLDAKREALE